MGVKERCKQSNREDAQHPPDTDGTRELSVCEAVDNNDATKLKDLLLKGAKCQCDSQRCLHNACMRGFLDIVILLLDHGCNIHALSKYDSTPLHQAVEGRHLEVVKELLKRGGCEDLEKKTMRNSYTPLFIACENGDFHMFELLLAHNGNIFATDAIGRSLLHVAKSRDIIQNLVKKGLAVNITDNTNDTALHYAALDYDKERIEALLEEGADPTLRNNYRQTPRDIAEPQKVWDDEINCQLLEAAEKVWVPKHHQPDTKTHQAEIFEPLNMEDEEDLSEDSVFTCLRPQKEDLTPEVVPSTHKYRDGITNNNLRLSLDVNANQAIKREKKDLGNKMTFLENKNTRRKRCHQGHSSSTKTFKVESFRKENRSALHFKKLSDREIGIISRNLNRKQVKRVRRLVRREVELQIREEEKGNSKLEYFKLLKAAQISHGTMPVKNLLEQIRLTRSFHNKVSSKKLAKLKKDMMMHGLERIPVTNITLTTNLSRLVNKNYYSLGIEMGLSEESMEEIHALKSESLAERSHQTFRKLMERYPRKSCCDIILAIANIGLNYDKALDILLQSKCFPIRYVC